MDGKWDRRTFLRAAAGSLAALGLGPVTALGRTAGPRTAAAADGLPPRVVGLRTLGGDFRFDPVGLAVRPGDSVTWLNMGDFHTTTAFHPANADLISGEMPGRIPDGAEPWHSGMLGLTAGTRFDYTFQVPGLYDYFCQPHYGFGMVGRVIAVPEGGEAPAAPPAAELVEAAREEMPAVETVVGPRGRTFEWAARINGLLLMRTDDAGTGPAAEALVEGIRRDRALQEVLGDAGVRDGFPAKLDRLVDGLAADRGYEELVSRADAVKDALATARGRSTATA